MPLFSWEVTERQKVYPAVVVWVCIPFFLMPRVCFAVFETSGFAPALATVVDMIVQSHRPVDCEGSDLRSCASLSQETEVDFPIVNVNCDCGKMQVVVGSTARTVNRAFSPRMFRSAQVADKIRPFQRNLGRARGCRDVPKYIL